MTARRRFTTFERQEAIMLARQVGAAEAGRRLEIDPATIRKWLQRAAAEGRAAAQVIAKLTPAEDVTPGVTPTVTPEQRSATIEALTARRGEPWSSRSLEVATALGDVAVDGLAATHAAIRENRPRDAKDLATAMAITIDKAMLLSGRPTSHVASHRRVEVVVDPAELAAKVQRARADLAEVVDAEVVEDEDGGDE